MLNRMNKGEVASHEVGGNMLPLHARILNPLVVDMVGPGDPNVMALMTMGVSKDKAYDIVEKAYEKQGGPGKHVYTRAKALGHDAMIIKRNGKIQEVIHYNPKMIKSATGNRGTYDTTKDDLSMAEGGSVMGINVASDRKAGIHYADLIVDGKKTIETRNSDTLRPYVGKRVAIVRTGSGPAKAIGEVTIGEPMVANKAKFRAMQSKHMVPEGSMFDITTPTKHLYPLHSPVRYDDERDVGHGIVSRKVIHKDKGGKIEVRPTVFDDAASRRNPKIEEAARALLAGNIKQKDYEKLVAKEKPVKPYSFIPKPATDKQAMDVLLDRQKQNWRSHEGWPAGHPVGLRLDIPAYERHGVWVNSVHDESGQKPARPTSYGPVSSVRNAEFHGSPHKAARVATGEQSKTPFARIMGNIEHMDEEQAVKHFKKYMNHPDYRQIGYDPRRHGDFYDRETMQPVTHSEHVVQIGPLVLAKKPVYGKRTVYAKGGEVNKAKFLEGSKVKDRLYHTTSKDFASFDPNADERGNGMMFFSNEPFDHPDKEQTISMPVYVRAKKIFDARKSIPKATIDWIKKNSHLIHKELSDYNDDRGLGFAENYFDPSKPLDPDKYIKRLKSSDWQAIEAVPSLVKHLKSTGHDAIKAYEEGLNTYGIFNPNSIKSAIGNRGTFDPKNPDITKKRGGRVTHAHHLEIEERPL
jgi:hypothetical protein